MWRVGSTAQTEFTAKRTNKIQGKYHLPVFDLGAFVAESGRRFSSGFTANPKLILPMNMREPRMLQLREAAKEPGHER
jgi:hypothetical protein